MPAPSERTAAGAPSGWDWTTSEGAVTDAAGRFQLTGLPAGVRRLRLSAPGYQAAEQEVDLEHLGSVELGDVGLEAVAPPAA